MSARKTPVRQTPVSPTNDAPGDGVLVIPATFHASPRAAQARREPVALVAHDAERRSGADLYPMHGIVLGVAVSVAFWAVVGVLVSLL